MLDWIIISNYSTFLNSLEIYKEGRKEGGAKLGVNFFHIEHVFVFDYQLHVCKLLSSCKVKVSYS